MPSIPGILMSMSTTSGRSSRIRSIADCPSEASPTISKSGSHAQQSGQSLTHNDVVIHQRDPDFLFHSGRFGVELCGDRNRNPRLLVRCVLARLRACF